ncbi:hypothetical protein K438DRAFT_1768559 [Mycena galopus ATCC 62051]|nr:hypothetical protein K438DRAFT_1768559 [Mycena galopus ATCC 62051]
MCFTFAVVGYWIGAFPSLRRTDSADNRCGGSPQRACRSQFVTRNLSNNSKKMSTSSPDSRFSPGMSIKHSSRAMAKTQHVQSFPTATSCIPARPDHVPRCTPSPSRGTAPATRRRSSSTTRSPDGKPWTIPADDERTAGNDGATMENHAYTYTGTNRESVACLSLAPLPASSHTTHTASASLAYGGGDGAGVGVASPSSVQRSAAVDASLQQNGRRRGLMRQQHANVAVKAFVASKARPLPSALAGAGFMERLLILQVATGIMTDWRNSKVADRSRDD